MEAVGPDESIEGHRVRVLPVEHCKANPLHSEQALADEPIRFAGVTRKQVFVAVDRQQPIDALVPGRGRGLFARGGRGFGRLGCRREPRRQVRRVVRLR